MTTRSIDVMLSKPGVYVVCTRLMVGPVEVDDEGRCWALRVDNLERECEMAPGGRILDNIVGILGPFARMRAGDNNPLRVNFR